MAQIQFNFDNSYARELEGFYVPFEGDDAPKPELIKLNTKLAQQLNLDPSGLAGAAGAEFFSGSKIPEGANPLAQAYAGHQFGGFSAQLGDGRALLLGEVIDVEGKRRDIQLKGSGRTPFSRGGDGKAALGPVLREYILSEAMFGLGIPTTRALAVVTTGGEVIRETVLPGAVLARVASSHLRVGTFQFFAARGEVDKVRQLADYAIARHYPHLKAIENPYLSFLEAVAESQAALIAKWMLVGFVHGVMNTDNMTISGETIDYGPCAFLDHYDPDAVFSSIDAQGRYAYQNQPPIGQWNIARLAETLLPLIDRDNGSAIEKATEVVNLFSQKYLALWLEGMGEKLGLQSSRSQDDQGFTTSDIDLINAVLTLMHDQKTDFTRFFRSLGEAVTGRSERLLALFEDASAIEPWLDQWRHRLGEDTRDNKERAHAMNRINPIYVARNHKVEEALSDAVTHRDFTTFEKLITVLEQPFDQRAGLEKYEQAAPDDFGPYRTFCGT